MCRQEADLYNGFLWTCMTFVWLPPKCIFSSLHLSISKTEISVSLLLCCHLLSLEIQIELDLRKGGFRSGFNHLFCYWPLKVTSDCVHEDLPFLGFYKCVVFHKEFPSKWSYVDYKQGKGDRYVYVYECACRLTATCSSCTLYKIQTYIITNGCAHSHSCCKVENGQITKSRLLYRCLFFLHLV